MGDGEHLVRSLTPNTSDATYLEFWDENAEIFQYKYQRGLSASFDTVFYMENKFFQKRNTFSISWKTPIIQNSKGVLAIGVNQDIKWIPEADFQEARAKGRKDRIKRETNLRKICSFVLNFCHRKLGNEGLKTKQNTKKTRVRKVLQEINYWHCGQYKWKDPNLVVGGGGGLGTACRDQIQGKKK